MAKVDAGDRFYASGCGIVGIPLGALISRLFGQTTTFYAAAALCFSCVAVALNMRETLRREDRRPFTLAGAISGSAALSLRTTDHPLYTKSTNSRSRGGPQAIRWWERQRRAADGPRTKIVQGLPKFRDLAQNYD
jgi:hypothetical protein